MVHAVIDIPESAPARFSTTSAHRKPWTRLQWCGQFSFGYHDRTGVNGHSRGGYLPREESRSLIPSNAPTQRLQTLRSLLLPISGSELYNTCYFPFQVQNYTTPHRHSMLHFIGWPMKTRTGTTIPTSILKLSPSLPLQRSMSFWASYVAMEHTKGLPSQLLFRLQMVRQ